MLLSVSLLIGTGCSDYAVDDEINAMLAAKKPVDVDLAFTVSKGTGSATRMAPAVVQSGNSDFRGLQSLRAIPFAISANADAVTNSDQAKTFEPSGNGTQYTGKNNDVPAPAASATPESKANFYYFENCSFISGVNAFLAYANATAATYTGTNAYCSNTDINNKLYNGSLKATIPFRGNPTEINFAPEQIVTSTSVLSDNGTDGAKIASYLTNIANATGWSTSSNSKLHAYYLNFIGQGNEETTMVMASSTANVEKLVGTLLTQISGLTLGTDDAAIQDAIINAIDAGYDATTGKLEGYPANYPASIGLPAGAAAVRWTGSAFEVQTQTTTLAKINTVTRFAYPAELYYYANSRIRTSNSEVTNYSTATNWGTLLEEYEYNPGTVSTNTKAAAIKNPLQYAVGRFDVKFNACSTPLKDANDKDVTIGDNTFPLTGIIVGSQRPVSFDFTPTAESDGTYSDLNVRFIYDAYPTGTATSLYLNTTGSGDNVASTLVLQTPDGEEVTVILEFLNNGTQTFRGKDGVVYPGTKFYLIGKLTADETETTDYKKRVFTRDYITLAPMSVNSLANAYNVIPDILSSRLEVGIEIADWIAATPFTVPLN
jgi:hypothetical protein